MVRTEKILILVPVWNEEDKVAKVINDLKQHTMYDILVVDDGSSDQTTEVAEKTQCMVIKHAINLGVGAAIRTAIKYALQHDYDILVPVSGSGKTPAEYIPNLVNPILKENYDFVQGSRYLKAEETLDMPLHRSIGTKMYSFIFSLILNHRITDGSSGFRAMKVAMFKDKRFQIDQDWLNRYELEPYLYYQCIRLGYKVKEVPVEIIYPHKKHYTKMRALVDWWSITRPIFYLKFGIKN
jgi:dolichol-phosphate mannosyltransferase